MPKADPPPPSYTLGKPSQPAQPSQWVQPVRSPSTPYTPGKPSQAAHASQPVDLDGQFDWIDVADCALNHRFALPKNPLEDLALDFRLKFIQTQPEQARVALKLIVLGAKAARDEERAKASEGLMEVVRGARSYGPRAAAAAKSIKAEQRRVDILARYDDWIAAQAAYDDWLSQETGRRRVMHGQKTSDRQAFADQHGIKVPTLRAWLADRERQVSNC